MTKIFFLFALLFAVSLSAQQFQNEKLFGTSASPTNLDTLTAEDSIATSRAITYSVFLDVKGGVTIWGHANLISGTFSAITVTAAMLNGENERVGPFHTVGTIDTADVWDFSLSRLSWWGPNRGFKIISGNAEIR